MTLETNDVIHLQSTNFYRSAGGAALLDVSSNAGNSTNVIRTASWNQYDQVLVLTLGQTIAARTLLQVTIPLSVGLVLPSMGIRSDATLNNIRIRSDARAGIVHSTLVTNVQAVGFFDHTKIAFQPWAKAANVSSISIVFTPLMLLRQGDQVRLELTGFTSNSSAVTLTWTSGADSASSVSEATAGTWLSSSASLIVPVPQTVAANDRYLKEIIK